MFGRKRSLQDTSMPEAGISGVLLCGGLKRWTSISTRRRELKSHNQPLDQSLDNTQRRIHGLELRLRRVDREYCTKAPADSRPTISIAHVRSRLTIPKETQK
jgi:hypothetical protein